MSAGNILLAQLGVGRVVQSVVVRLLRHWFARNVKKGGQLMSLDLLFVDEQSTVIQASIGVQHISAFQSKLREGSLYVLSCFDAARSKDKYRMCDFHLALRLSAATSLIEIAEHLPLIPKQVFRLRSYQDLASLAKTSFDMPDVVGQIFSTKTFDGGVGNTLEKVILYVRLESGEEVRVTAYDSHAVTVATALKTKNKDSCVVLATNVNPKFYGDVLYLNSTSATKFFFDDEVDETKLLIQRLQVTNSVEKFVRVQKVEAMTIAGINNFILTEPPQDIEFICKAKISNIETKRGWNFISCSSCARKLQQEETSLVCNNCHAKPVVGIVRYRVEMGVEDDTDSAVFVVFNSAMEKVTKIEASKITAETNEAGQSGEESATIPDIIMGLIGSTFTFQLRLTHFNFSSYHESFTVSRIFTSADEIPKPKFTEMESAASSKSKAATISASEQNVSSSAMFDDVKNKKQRIV